MSLNVPGIWFYVRILRTVLWGLAGYFPLEFWPLHCFWLGIVGLQNNSSSLRPYKFFHHDVHGNVWIIQNATLLRLRKCNFFTFAARLEHTTTTGGETGLEANPSPRPNRPRRTQTAVLGVWLGCRPRAFKYHRPAKTCSSFAVVDIVSSVNTSESARNEALGRRGCRPGSVRK